MVPRERGGWWHAYVCPVHGVELAHDGLLSGVFPDGGARCRYGCRIDTPEVRGAWTVLAHQACARAAVPQTLEEYAALYGSLGDEHGGAQEWMLRGRLFHQALTEAIWAVSIGRAPGAERVPELLKELAVNAAAARATLTADGRFDSNYTAWLLAAEAVCGAPRSDLVYEHVLAATRADGWEWEGSAYYHAFVLRAYLLALRGVDGVPAEVAGRLRAMARVIGVLRTDAGELPALHDGPYHRPDAAREIQELACLVDLPAATSPVTIFPDAGYAVLRSAGIHAVVDFGPHGGSHGHRDKLSLYLYDQRAAGGWQPDPGQVPYGHRPLREYYASSAAHPTFTVDGLEQAECAGRLIDSGDGWVRVGCDTAYEGVQAVRRVGITDDGGLLDELTVGCDRPREVAAHLRPAVPLTVRQLADGTVESAWNGHTLLRGRHSADGASMLARPGRGPADDPMATVTHVDWLAPATTSVTFRSEYRT